LKNKVKGGTTLAPKSKAKSFLRWVGGKRQLVTRLMPYLPSNLNGHRYHEPFAGAANLYFALGPKTATLSDLNTHLIECYRQIRDKPSKVAAYLQTHAKLNSKEYYYRVRELYNRSKPSPAQAARFIYLNRTCFNGVFRVNTDGKFNVPYGDKPNPIFPTAEELQSIAKMLKRTRLSVGDFRSALAKTKKSEFVYLDPPYPPLNGTAYFTHYTADRFSIDNQTSLAAEVKKLHKRGVHFLMTNADLPKIRELYNQFHISKLSVTRYVSCKGTRHRVGELVITNYRPQKKKQKAKEA
jgi:DNA adenine methylase